MERKPSSTRTHQLNHFLGWERSLYILWNFANDISMFELEKFVVEFKEIEDDTKANK